MFSNIVGRVMDGKLKTNAKWWEIYGANPKEIIHLIKEHWVTSVLTLFLLVAGVIKSFY